MSAVPDTRIADLVRGGQIRIGLFPSFLYAKRTDGDLSGFGIEFARTFAACIGLDLVLREYPTPPAAVQALNDAECDIAFLGIDPKRAADVDFSPPYLKADFTFLVPAGSAALQFADVDCSGQRIAIVRDHAMEYALKGQLRNAQTVYATTPDEAFALLRSGHADVLAGIRPGLLKYADALAGSRVLEGRYGQNTLALAVAKGQAGRLAYVSDFIVEARTSELLQRVIAETGLTGVEPVLT